MNKITDETDIMISDDKSVILTTHRIRQENKQWGKLHIKSILLEHVSSCEYNRKSSPIYLVLGLIMIIFGAGLMVGGSHGVAEVSLIAIAIGFVLLIFYWITIRKGLQVSSSSAKIIMNTNGMKDENIKAFIDRLEEAKINRTANKG